MPATKFKGWLQPSSQILQGKYSVTLTVPSILQQLERFQTFREGKISLLSLRKNMTLDTPESKIDE